MHTAIYPCNQSSLVEPQSDVYALWQVCRRVGRDAPPFSFCSEIQSMEFHVDTATKLSYAVKNPPPETETFFARPPLPKNSSIDVFRSMRSRLQQLVETPSVVNEFSEDQIMACESLGHTARIKASVEKDPIRRSNLIKRASFMYEAGLRMTAHSTVVLMLDRIARHPTEVYVVRMNERMDTLSPDLRRFFTSAFTGLAICAIYEDEFQRFGSFASLTAGWDDVGGIFALAVIRTIAMLNSQLEMYLFLTRTVLLPYLVRTGRHDIMVEDLAVSVPRSIREDTASVAVALALRFSGSVSGKQVRTRIVGGQVLERVCAVCDADDVKLRHCSLCRAVYYCGKECQKAHWAQHKAVCKR